jgi:hypothetical protein
MFVARTLLLVNKRTGPAAGGSFRRMDGRRLVSFRQDSMGRRCCEAACEPCSHALRCVCAERSGRRSSRTHGPLVAALRAHFRVHVPDMMMLAVAAHKGHSLTQVARLRGAFFFSTRSSVTSVV